MKRGFVQFVFFAMATADLWFLFMIQAVFYSPERAFEIATAKIPEAVEYWNIEDLRLEGPILSEDRTLFERASNIPAIYTRGHRFYPMHEFIWEYGEGEDAGYLWIGISPIGKADFSKLERDHNLEEMILYQQ